MHFVLVDFGNGRAMRIYTRAFRSFGKGHNEAKTIRDMTFMAEYYATCRFQLDAYGERAPTKTTQWEVITAQDLSEIFGCVPAPLSGQSEGKVWRKQAKQLHRMKFGDLVQEMKRISRLQRIGGVPITSGTPYSQTLFARVVGMAYMGSACEKDSGANPARSDSAVVRWNNRNVPKPRRG